VDTTGIAKGSGDATKIVRLECNGISSGTTIVLTVQDTSGTIALVGHVHSASDTTSGQFADARIAESNVTQYEAALSITESQISDLGSYSVTGHDHAAGDITSGELTHERGGLETDVSGYGGVALIDGGTTSELKYNLVATVDPTADEDSDDGYTVGSRWINVTLDKEFVLLDATVGAAVWTETTGAGGGSGGGCCLTVIKKAVSYTAVSGDLVVCDSSGGSITITMPAAPTLDDVIGIYLEAGNFTLNTTIQGNGKTLGEFGSSIVMHGPGELFVFQYDGAKWVLSGQSGGPLVDSKDHFFGSADPTKILRFSVASVSTATTRTLTAPDASGTIELEGHSHVASDVTDFSDAVNAVAATRSIAGLARVVATSDVTIYTKDVSTLTYSSDDWATAVADPRCCEVSPDGTRMYYTTNNFSDCRSHDLATPFDVSTAVVDYNRSLPVDITSPAAVRFKADDGTMFFILDDGDQTIYPFTCDPWDVSTGTFPDERLDTSSEGSSSFGFFIKPEGDKIFVLKASSNTVYQYDLSTPWDLDTGSYGSKSFSVASQTTQPYDITFTADGKTMYVAATDGDKFYEYTLSTAWDISTASYASNLASYASEDGHMSGICLTNNGRDLICSGSINDKIYRYSFHPGAPGNIDSVTLGDGDRVLLTGQTLDTENGMWTAVTALLPETWTRTADMAADDTASGRIVMVTAGTTNAATMWVCTTADGSDVVGTDDLSFTKVV
jgi:hypothetical protein